MKFKRNLPKNIEIKRAAMSKWETLPENARVDMDALTNAIELVEQFPGVSPVITSLYDVRDNLCTSWRAVLRGETNEGS